MHKPTKLCSRPEPRPPTPIFCSTAPSSGHHRPLFNHRPPPRDLTPFKPGPLTVQLTNITGCPLRLHDWPISISEAPFVNLSNNTQGLASECVDLMLGETFISDGPQRPQGGLKASGRPLKALGAPRIRWGSSPEPIRGSKTLDRSQDFSETPDWESPRYPQTAQPPNRL